MMESLNSIRGKSFEDINKTFKKDQLIKLLLAIPEDSFVLQDLAKNVQALNEKLDTLKNEQMETSKTVVSLVTENVILKDKVAKLEKARRLADQRSYIYDVEVSGVEGVDAADDEKKCVELFTAMGATVTANDIDACHKVKTRRKGQKQPVIVAFKSRKVRATVLACKKKLFELNGKKAVKDQQFVNMHLSPFNKFIYLNALRVKVKKNDNNALRTYKYVWTNDHGITLLR